MSNENIILVETINCSFLRIGAVRSIQQEMHDYFAFYAPNYRFMGRYKSGLWDGKIRLYSLQSRTLPAGLFDILVKFADDNGYEIIDNRDDPPFALTDHTKQDIDKFLETLDPHSDGDPIEYHDHQREAIEVSIKNLRATILSSTSSGKSLIIYALIRWYQERVEGKILILVPTVSLVKQMVSDFDDYASEDTWNAETTIHPIFAGKKKESSKQIYVSTWQSIYKQPPEYFQQFDVVFCDEAHTAEAKYITAIMNACVNAHVRIGFTGTLKSKRLHRLNVVALFGGIRVVATNAEMMEKDIISMLDIRFIVLRYREAISKEITRRVRVGKKPDGKPKYRNNYRFEMDFISSFKPRNNFILNLARSLVNGNTLILFQFVEKHGKPLYDLLSKNLKDRNVYFITGKTSANDRERIRKQMEKEKNAVLVASYGTLSTGVNIKNLHYVIFASPYKSEIKVLQSIGRVLRKCKGKKRAVLFDLVDDFRNKKYVNYLYKHFVARYDIYKADKFSLKIIEFDLA